MDMTSIYPHTCRTAGSSNAIGEMWYVVSSADHSIGIGCRRYERHPVVVVSFVARLEPFTRYFATPDLFTCPSRLTDLDESLNEVDVPVDRLTYSVIVWPVERSVRWTGFLRKHASAKKKKKKFTHEKSLFKQGRHTKFPVIPVFREWT